MFVDLQNVDCQWQSEDGLVQIGRASLDEIPVYFSYLGHRLVTLADIEGLLPVMKGLVRHATQSDRPLLLLSECPGFEPDVLAEERGLVFYVGHYRRCQQEWRDQGKQLVAAIDRIAVGGTFLIHGMAAPVRIATDCTQFYGALPPDNRMEVSGLSALPENGLEKALEIGLLSKIVTRDNINRGLVTALSSEGMIAL